MIYKVVDMNGHRLRTIRVIDDEKNNQRNLVKIEMVTIKYNQPMGNNIEASVKIICTPNESFNEMIRQSTQIDEGLFNKLKKHVEALSLLGERTIKNCS